MVRQGGYFDELGRYIAPHEISRTLTDRIPEIIHTINPEVEALRKEIKRLKKRVKKLEKGAE